MERSEYLVSLIVPVYNAEQYLPETFESVKKQTIGFENIQLIMVDDCSKDGSFALISSWAEEYPNVLVMQTPAGSGSASMPRNMGLDVAEADYVMFLDADDIIRPNAVKLLYDLTLEGKADLVDAAFCEFGDGAREVFKYQNAKEAVYNMVDDADEWFVFSHPIVTKLFNRAIIEDNKLRFFVNLRNGEDSMFLYQYMSHIDTAWHVNDVIYEYRIHSDSVSHNLAARYYKGLAETCSAIRDELCGTKNYRLYEKYIEETAVASLDLLCDSTIVSEEECREILPLWYPHLKYIAEHCLDTKVPIGEILAADAARDDYMCFEQDFFSMRYFYCQRRELINGVLCSRGWRLISAINRLLGRG